AEVLVRGEELRAEPAPAVLDADRRRLLVIRRAGQVGAEIALVVVGVVLRDQAPARQARRRPARAAEDAVDALPAVAEGQVHVADALGSRAEIGRASCRERVVISGVNSLLLKKMIYVLYA